MDNLSLGERLKIVVACSAVIIPYLLITVGALVAVYFLCKLVF